MNCLHAFVGGHIRRHRRFEQGQVDAVAVDVHAVLAVVEHGHAAVFLGQRGPLVVADLKAVGVKRARAVVGAAQVAELDFVDGLVGVDVDREGDLEQLVALLPVDGGGEIDAPAAAAQADDLADAGFVQLARAATGARPAARSRAISRLTGSSVSHRLHLSHAVQVPGVPVVGHVFVQAQAVARRRPGLALGFFIPEAGHLAARR